MANLWSLPTSIEVNGTEYAIRTDYRAVLDILTAFSDREMECDSEEDTNMVRALIILNILFKDKVKQDDVNEALQKAVEFIDMGLDRENDRQKRPILMDWAQDAPLIIPAVNRVIGKEVRAVEYMHWWTFLSAYMEIGECSFSHILSIRSKKEKGKKLEKWEQEYIQENKSVVLLKRQLTETEKAELETEKEAIKNLFGG